MCIGCWQEYGAPTLVNENTIRAAGLIDRIYEFDCSGAYLHVVIDDWNLDDDCLSCSARHLAEDVSGDYAPAELEAQRECLTALQALTEDERATALAIHSGFIHGIQKMEVQHG